MSTAEVKSEPRRATDFAMDGLKPPPTLGLDSLNLAKTWKSWKEEFTLYTDLTMPDAEEATKVKLFIYLLGERGRELLNTLSSGEASVSARRTVSSMMALIDGHCNPKLNETVERYKFFVRDQDTQLEKSEKVLVMYNKSRLKPLGTCKIKLRIPRNNKLYRLEFQVVDQDDRIPLLGRKASEAMKLIKVQYENILAIDSIVTKQCPDKPSNNTEELLNMDKIKTEFGDVFTGVGCLEGEYKIEIDKTVPPVKLPKRRVPVAMMAPLKQELKDLEAKEIIAPVERSTDWISSMVSVTKPNGKPRICIDPKPLNKALKRSHFPLPTIDDILPELANAKVFTVCDVKHGFWHVRLDEESSYLTTFATPFGRYRWLRMPMGISPAPEVFQRKLMQALEGLPGVYVIADDVLITGEGDTLERANVNHNENLRRFLQRCRQKDIKLNADKFKLRKQSVPYIGHLLTAEGLRIDPEKVRAIRELPQPTDIKGVQRLVGMLNYLSKFCDHLSEDCEVLRQLTHKDNIWEWTEVHETALSRLKDKITNAPLLKYYDQTEELTLQCDASETGLGAALTQKGKPVAFSSRALTPTERGYAQIEKECLAIVFGMEKFHQYTYGRKVTVQSDHKPLENIVRKPLLSAPKRLQRMLLRLQKYDIMVVYVPGRDMLLADTLSRAYLSDSTQGDTESELETVNMITYLPISAERLAAIREATKDDTKLQKVKKLILTGWPVNKKDMDLDIGHYFSFQDELSYQDGVVFRGERAVIPDTLRADITCRIHSSHLGVEGCLRRARECVYWQGMTDQIKTFIAKCDICRSVDPKQQKESLQPHDFSYRPWAKVGTDLFSWRDKDYMVTVDYFSNFWEVDYLPDTKSTTVIHKLKAHFARQGIPDVLVSDNGPQYSSQEFKSFSTKWEFQHRTSSPGYPQSNGKAESAVKTAKRLMKKAAAAGQDPYLAILDHRNTPSQGLNTSPAQRLLCRRTRTLLPTKETLLEPKITNDQHGLSNNRRRQEKYYNRTAKNLDCFKEGDSVRVQPFEPHKTWKVAKVIKPVSLRSYEVELESGGVLRRNRRHLRHNHCPPAPPAQTAPVTDTPTVIPAQANVTTTRSGRKREREEKEREKVGRKGRRERYKGERRKGEKEIERREIREWREGKREMRKKGEEREERDKKKMERRERKRGEKKRREMEREEQEKIERREMERREKRVGTYVRREREIERREKVKEKRNRKREKREMRKKREEREERDREERDGELATHYTTETTHYTTETTHYTTDTTHYTTVTTHYTTVTTHYTTDTTHYTTVITHYTTETTHYTTVTTHYTTETTHYTTETTHYTTETTHYTTVTTHYTTDTTHYTTVTTHYTTETTHYTTVTTHYTTETTHYTTETTHYTTETTHYTTVTTHYTTETTHYTTVTTRYTTETTHYTTVTTHYTTETTHYTTETTPYTTECEYHLLVFDSFLQEMC
ncbi:hypothetical protein WMY93_018396 [Mugilogobius chulae]|uniref:Gypsy retrotransposon integrase-like protein 1 n=1 Tax=Mugilogobius chulae TaxID=88201 RepID=A0AAW0NUP6_9GOBI